MWGEETPERILLDQTRLNPIHPLFNKKAMLSHGELRDADVNFDTYQF